ncbi:MAG TPA: CoA transferase [Candidatus Binataceae bacterium]|nr:CoA transferase [Candidatus Binataceae bacterium]
MSGNAPKHLLDGYKVLDFTHFIAGPTATRLMAGMGAEVVKIELAPHGDQAREIDFIRDKRSAYFIQQNRGKQSICLDMKKPAAVDLIKRMIPKFDVMVENFAPGIIASMGLDYQTVSALNPGMIMCSISALGQTGPLAHDPGFDFIGQAYAGVTSLIGEEDGPPYMPMIAIGDVSTGVHAMGAIACALLYREKTGEGQYIDISLLDSYFHCQTVAVELYSASGGKRETKRSGLHHPFFCPAGTFKGQKWHIIILAWLDQHWARVCEAIGKPELARDPRYADTTRRGQRREEIIKLIEDWLAAMPSDEESIDALRVRRVPVAPILSVREAMSHPHLLERGTIRTVEDRVLGKFQIPGFPLRFSKFPAELEFDAPFLGEHNSAVLAKYLGCAAEEVARLERDGVLFSAHY